VLWLVQRIFWEKTPKSPYLEGGKKSWIHVIWTIGSCMLPVCSKDSNKFYLSLWPVAKFG
jgi:hypothetical protein